MPKRCWSTRAVARLACVTIVAGAIVAAVPARAEASTVMTASFGVFTGTPGPDLLAIGKAGDYLTHNRFALGDPGFASNTDFDSIRAGVQTRLASGADRVSFNGLEGDDVFRLTGYIRNTVIGGFDLGAGTDKIDAAGMTDGIYLGLGTEEHIETVELVVGSSYPDTVNGWGNNAPRSAPLAVYGRGGDDNLQGTEGPDTIDGGMGINTITALGGNDVVSVAAPVPTYATTIDGGAGTDMLVLNGTNSADALAIDGGRRDFWLYDLNASGDGYHALGFERGRLNLLGGDDFGFVTSTLANAGVFGGGGDDGVVIDAHKSTAKVEDLGASVRVTVPLAFGNTYRAPAVVHLDTEVETTLLANETVIATAPGPGGGPHVRTFAADGSPLASFFAFDPSFTGGVNVAMGDLDGDFDDEIIVGAGPGGGPHVRVFYSDGTDTGVSFFAYDPSVTGGVNVAAVDIDGDGLDEIVTAPAKSYPNVRVWTGNGEKLADWWADFRPDGFNGGVHVARGAHTGAGAEDIVVSSGDGSGGAVRAYNGSGWEATDRFSVFSPYGGFGGGARASRALVKNSPSAIGSDTHDDIVTGAGPGGGPLVVVAERGADGHTVSVRNAFFAYRSTFTGGVEVATCNADGGEDEIVTAPGAGVAPLVRTFAPDGAMKRKSFLAYDPGFTAGINIACGGAISRAFVRALPQGASLGEIRLGALGRFQHPIGEGLERIDDRAVD